MLAFGEKCLYKVSLKQPKKTIDGKMSPRWKDGLFLGYSKDSNEFVIWSTHDKVVTRARSIQRRPESERWSPEKLMEVNQRPIDALYRAAQPIADRKEPDRAFDYRPTQEDEGPKTRASNSRDMKVTLGDLKRFGFTEVGCPRCDYIQEHGQAKDCGHAHSVVCRERIKRLLSESEEGRARLEAFDERRKKREAVQEKGGEELERKAAEELIQEGAPRVRCP